MSANLEAKTNLIEEIKNKLKKAKTVAFVDYRGITVEADTAMRASFRNANSEYRVYKNRLMLRALNELGIHGCESYLKGTSAVAFGYGDEVTPAKLVLDAVNKTGKIQIKFGILNGKIVSAEEVTELAKLPSKEVLIAKLLGMLNAPASSLVRVLNAPVSGLAIALGGIAKK